MLVNYNNQNMYLLLSEFYCNIIFFVLVPNSSISETVRKQYDQCQMVENVKTLLCLNRTSSKHVMNIH